MNHQDKVDRVMGLTESLQMTEYDFARLAMMCLDQAGLSLREQDSIHELLVLGGHLPKED